MLCESLITRFYYSIKSFFIENFKEMRTNKMGTIKENYQMMFTTYPDVVTISQLKEMLSIGITLAYRLVKQNTINAIKIGREYKIPKANVIAYLTKQNEI